jgi:hypothetical protein
MEAFDTWLHPGTVSVRELLDLLEDRRSGQKPFYIIGHNTNSVEKVNSALDAGANALEVDVTAYEFNLDRLCIDHAGLIGDAPGDASAPSLTAFLPALRAIVDSRPQLALIVFDCKPPAATPAHGRTLLEAIRSILAGNNLNIIISVADITANSPYKLNGTTMFDFIVSDLGPREALMVDAQDSPDDVSQFFESRGITRSVTAMAPRFHSPTRERWCITRRLSGRAGCVPREMRRGLSTRGRSTAAAVKGCTWV